MNRFKMGLYNKILVSNKKDVHQIKSHKRVQFKEKHKLMRTMNKRIIING